MDHYMPSQLSEFQSLILPMLDAIDAQMTVAIGNDHSTITPMLLERAQNRAGLHIGIDPHADTDLIAMFSDYEGIILPQWSLDSLEVLGAADAYILDGDHNYYTVLTELRAIRQQARKNDRPFPLILLHDVIWPYARRDHYMDPNRIPPEHRHANSTTLGVRMGEPLADAGGYLSGNGAFAIREGGPRNGVLTAIEDFMKETEDLKLSVIPRAFGLGILTTESVAQKIWPCIAAETNDSSLMAKEFKRLQELTEKHAAQKHKTA